MINRYRRTFPPSMLFTRCPGCQTTFRITADTLRVANGAVRCGSCATVFSAFSGLQQDTLEDELQPDDEFLSPTVQTRELAGIEDLAGPELGDEPTALPDDARQPAAAGPPIQSERAEHIDFAAALNSEDDIQDVPVVDVPAETEHDPAQHLDAHDSAHELPEEAASAAPAPEPQLLDATSFASSESSDRLQFDPPTDEWALLLSEIEQSDDAPSAAEHEPGNDTVNVGEDSDEDATDSDADGPWNVGDPATGEAWHEIETSDDEAIGNERVAVGELSTAPDLDAPLGDARIEADVAELLEEELDISAEQVDATLSDDPEPELVAGLAAASPTQSTGEERSHVWTVGTVALTLALAFQLIHYFRAPLAGQSVVGPLVQSAYGLVGAELVPEWDLDQYEILNWVATEAGLGNLRITAQIRNNGPRPQPYPHIHLELKDRWEAVVGSRVFEPGEYLEPDASNDGLMVAGVTVPADLAVVDPGADAYGFELDVCVPRGAGGLSCASQRVFE